MAPVLFYGGMRLSVVLVLVPLALAVPVSGGANQVETGRQDSLRKPTPEMAAVPGGTFVMGVDKTELDDVIESCRDEIGQEASPYFCEQMRNFPESFVGQQRVVYLSAYEIDRFETTVGDYRACVSAGACDLVPLVTGDTRFVEDDLPVVNVSWFDADSYCHWQHKRLPTEAEWEKAARGREGRRWPWGMVDGNDRANRGRFEAEWLRPARLGEITITTDDSDGAKIMVPPGTYRWGKSPYGVYDLSGNVSEWIADWLSPYGYAGLSKLDPRGAASGTFRVVRGGSYDEPRFFARTYYRNGAKPTSRSTSRGFRCARSLD
jgi:formylglycine-generating enzyme required for sulfatase activity